MSAIIDPRTTSRTRAASLLYLVLPSRRSDGRGFQGFGRRTRAQLELRRTTAGAGAGASAYSLNRNALLASSSKAITRLLCYNI